MLKQTLIAAVGSIAMVGSAIAGTTLPIVAEHGSHGGQGFGYPNGNLPNMTDGSGMTIPDANDPSTWTANSNGWTLEWQSGSLLSGAVDNKIAWVAFDLGSDFALGDLYIWNQRENNGRFTDSYKVHVGSSLSVALPPDSQQSGFANDVGWGPGDYDFGSSGWTEAFSGNLSNRNTDGVNVNAVIDLSGFTGQFVAIEIFSNTGDNNRVGLAEVGITAGDAVIPTPGAAVMAFAGLAGMAIRRRRNG